jgi:hypothetical protein
MLEEREYQNLQLGAILLQFRSLFNLTCCFSEIKLSVILTSSILSSRIFAGYFFTEMNFLPANPSHIPASHSFMPSLHSTWLLAETAVARYQMPHISLSILLPSTLLCFDIKHL